MFSECQEDFQDEINIIKFIAVKNGYKSEMINKLLRKYKNTQNKNVETDKNKSTFIFAVYTNLVPNIILNDFK